MHKLIITISKYSNTVLSSSNLASLLFVLKQKFMYKFSVSWVGKIYHKGSGASFYSMKLWHKLHILEFI